MNSQSNNQGNNRGKGRGRGGGKYFRRNNNQSENLPGEVQNNDSRQYIWRENTLNEANECMGNSNYLRPGGERPKSKNFKNNRRNFTEIQNNYSSGYSNSNKIPNSLNHNFEAEIRENTRENVISRSDKYEDTNQTTAKYFYRNQQRKNRQQNNDPQKNKSNMMNKGYEDNIHNNTKHNNRKNSEVGYSKNTRGNFAKKEKVVKSDVEPDVKNMNLREKLEYRLKKNLYECMVCICTIGRTAPVWSCDNCFNVIHLVCVQQWATANEGSWACPICQQRYDLRAADMSYRCFCGKVDRPAPGAAGWDQTPHSCGDACGREGAQCRHRCGLHCHPGPCPPCKVMMPRRCGCGTLSVSVRCGTAAVCDAPQCGRLLQCGKHKCLLPCHEGDCGECSQPISSLCHCEANEMATTCGQLIDGKQLSCGKVCGRTYECGIHSCPTVCHPRDQCNTVCETSPKRIKHCSCGRTRLAVPRLACTDPVLSCSNMCGLPLSCGVHKCRKICCTATEHICPRVCDRQLSCGSHTCQASCGEHYSITGRHSCPPCLHFSTSELHCECGTESLMPPVACGTRPPPCRKPCTRVHSCEHEVLHECHSEAQCSPCTVLTSKLCLGGHTQMNNLACHLPELSCGHLCGLPLSADCGHSCPLLCHAPPCSDTVCSQPCTQLRSCSHPCGLPCHHPLPCPATACRQPSSMYCSCQLRSHISVCSALPTSSLTCSPACSAAQCLQTLSTKVFSPPLATTVLLSYYTTFLTDFCRYNFRFVQDTEKLFTELIAEHPQRSPVILTHRQPKALFLKRFASLHRIDCQLMENPGSLYTVKLIVTSASNRIPKFILSRHTEKIYFKDFKPNS